jgi:hypothetical protein
MALGVTIGIVQKIISPEARRSFERECSRHNIKKTSRANEQKLKRPITYHRLLQFQLTGIIQTPTEPHILFFHAAAHSTHNIK